MIQVMRFPIVVGSFIAVDTWIGTLSIPDLLIVTVWKFQSLVNQHAILDHVLEFLCLHCNLDIIWALTEGGIRHWLVNCLFMKRPCLSICVEVSLAIGSYRAVTLLIERLSLSSLCRGFMVQAFGSNRAMNYPFHGGALFRHLC
ncbi:uncharacterized protein [Solanum lycopersicum]|uniref:uncharacterized protein isoform X2 n=1 Tax=Solanum lycopersicum TaxID=4081 RepID=UPI00374A8AD9